MYSQLATINRDFPSALHHHHFRQKWKLRKGTGPPNNITVIRKWFWVGGHKKMKQKSSEDNNETVSIFGYLWTKKKKRFRHHRGLQKHFLSSAWKIMIVLRCQQKFRKKKNRESPFTGYYTHVPCSMFNLCGTNKSFADRLQVYFIIILCSDFFFLPSSVSRTSARKESYNNCFSKTIFNFRSLRRVS